MSRQRQPDTVRGRAGTSSLRSALRSRTLGRTLVLLALVGSILIGLLAMHTIASGSGGHGEPGSAMSDGMTAHGGEVGMATPAQAGMLGACSGLCDPGHIMSSMACVLALLFTGLLLTISRRWTTVFAALRARWRAIVAVASVAVPPPPDLNALSISRT